MAIYNTLVGLNKVEVGKAHRDLVDKICKDKILGIRLLDATTSHNPVQL